MAQPSIYLKNSARDLFFRDETIIEGIDKASVKALSRASGKIKLTAQRIFRPPRQLKFDKKSGFPLPVGDPAPAPARYHTKNPPVHIRNIQYGINRSTNTLVIGPIWFSPKRRQRESIPRETLPELLEKGGTAVVTIYTLKENESLESPIREYFADQPDRALKQRKITQSRQARPFMGPALDKNIDKIPAGFAGILQ
jgi:hypothetical protein